MPGENLQTLACVSRNWLHLTESNSTRISLKHMCQKCGLVRCTQCVWLAPAGIISLPSVALACKFEMSSPLEFRQPSRGCNALERHTNLVACVLWEVYLHSIGSHMNLPGGCV